MMSKRGRNRGRGGGPNFRLDPSQPLSKLLNADRPFLKPIVFVKAQHNPVLFQEEEEIFQPMEADAGLSASRLRFA